MTGEFIKAFDSASDRTGVPWSLVLLLGGAHFGYCLDRDEVKSRNSEWVVYAGQYKIMEEPLPVRLFFKNLNSLFNLLQLPDAPGAAY